jgi:2,4-dienoyl-CoA reductase-like NADH-dependent reductase (Old Yellow Enzyme family)
MTANADFFVPMSLGREAVMANRLMLAPLTNMQSHADGRLSDEEFRWLTMRASGGFGATMTCAAHVQARGQGFAGQLGIFDDLHNEGLTRLASTIKSHQSVALAQLHHAGIRSPKDLIGEQPVGPSDDGDTGARALTTSEVDQLIEDFVTAALRAEQCGFDGIEVHGAHNYIVCAFLSPDFNRRTDNFGGSAENRARMLLTIVEQIRARCRPNFVIGVRLSPERFGLQFADMHTLAAQLLSGTTIDFLDMSLWDCFKHPIDPDFADRPVIEHFTELPRGDVKLGVAGKLYTADAICRALDAGADFALLGRMAILHHDAPQRLLADEHFAMTSVPVTRDYLRGEGLSDSFVTYMATWPGFVTES